VRRTTGKYQSSIFLHGGNAHRSTRVGVG